MNRCPYCGKNMYRNSSDRLFFGFGGWPLFWGLPGFGWGWGWGGNHGWGGHHGWRDK